MDKKDSKLYAFQEWLEGKVGELLENKEIQIISRRKGDIENDINNALTTLGVAVVIEPPLPTEWADTVIPSAANVESEIHILENVLLSEVEDTAYSMLEEIAKGVHQQDYQGHVVTLGNPRDDSPADEPVIHFVLPVNNGLELF